MTKAELITEVKSRLTSAGISNTFWKDAFLLSWLNLAGQRVANWKRWPWLELAVTTTTENGRNYYDYPNNDDTGRNFKEHSIYEITIEDEDFPRRRVTWDEFRQAQTEESDDLIFANHEGFYFLYPVPADGKEMSLYGLKKWKPLVSDSDEPISPSELDESIIKTTLATALKKAGKRNEANDELKEVFSVVPSSPGTLMDVWNQSQVEASQGFMGQAGSSRWPTPNDNNR